MNIGFSSAAKILLSVKNLSLSFGGVLAVSDLNFDVFEGELFTLIGPNGAGKTTVFNLISRIYSPRTGRIDYLHNGKIINICDEPPHRIASIGIARTFQNIELFEHATVLQNLLIGRHIHRSTNFWNEMLFTRRTRSSEINSRKKIEDIIDLLDLQHYRDNIVDGLPYGVRKIVELARALCSEPRLLLLDEPSSGLNAEETEDMMYWISDIRRELGITILMVEHDMELVSRVSDRVMVMNMGTQLALGTPSEVQSNSEVIEAYLGSASDVQNLRRESEKPELNL